MRRTSTAQPAYDPLQFIALKPAANLAKKAEKQIEIVQETKKKRQSVDKDEAEWQFVSYLHLLTQSFPLIFRLLWPSDA